MDQLLTLATVPKILPLPKEVVNRIAAGEVVQRPASIAKELIENSIDAQSNTIEILSSHGGLQLLSVTDDGDGIHPQDLKLAATRFATSKLVHFEDLMKGIQTFGFRGEALASASMVSRLTITSRRRSLNDAGKFSKSCAYRQTYKDGKPTSSSPKPTAGNMGTVVKIEDLFYNVPNRKRAFHGTRKESEEYDKILNVVQRYAIHCASDGITFTCRKKGGHTDLNTQSLPTIKTILEGRKKSLASIAGTFDITKEKRQDASKEAISHIFGSEVAQELLSLSKTHGDLRMESAKYIPQETFSNTSETEIKPNNSKVQPKFTFVAKALITNPSYAPPRSAGTFILFINHRLVEFSSLKRAIESVYNESLSRGAKPFIYLDLELPGWHIDVNVHPTKREVAYLFEEELIEALVEEVRCVLGGASGSKIFQAKSLVPNCRISNNVEKKPSVKDIITNKKNEEISNVHETQNQDHHISTQIEKRKISMAPTPSTNKKKAIDPKNLVRTSAAAPEGALEPFLVPTQSQSLSFNETVNVSKSNVIDKESALNKKFQHAESCKFFNKNNSIDMTIPGAFASICQCQVKNPTKTLSGFEPSTTNNKIIRPRKVQPSECELTSILDLRSNITTQSHSQLTSKLRESTYVGIVSRQWCLIQWGVELLMVNHYILAKFLFYQLALWRFGEMEVARFTNLINVKKVIKDVLDSEEEMFTNDMNSSNTQMETNDNLSEQATQCLAGNKQMIEEYFSIQFEIQEGELYLSGLPILLENHYPQPHALPLFLLRLATEVNWEDEEKCFDGICRELGAFYAEVPTEDTDGNDQNNSSKGFKDKTAESFVKHTLFPAIISLLVPSQELASDHCVMKLASLPSLYKVFERC